MRKQRREGSGGLPAGEFSIRASAPDACSREGAGKGPSRVAAGRWWGGRGGSVSAGALINSISPRGTYHFTPVEEVRE